MMLTHHDRRDLMIEARFLPESIEQAKELRGLIRDVIERGEIEGITPKYSESVADSIVGWLVGKTDGVDGLSAPTRSKYRRVLSALEEEAPTGGGDGQRGAIGLGIAGVLAAAAAGAVEASMTGRAWAWALLPIIYVMSS